MEVRGLANISEGVAWQVPVSKIALLGCAGRARGPSIKVKDFGGAAPPHLHKACG